MKHTEPFEHEEYNGSDWINYLMGALMATFIFFVSISVATMIIDVVTGYQLHEVIGEVIK